jgi:Flp pilus assembly protein TadG
MLILCAGFSRCSRGTTTVEFAFVAPAMFLLMTASLFLGLLVYSAMGMQGAVEKAARCYSINDPQVNATQCKTASSTQTYAQSNYFGVGSPTFTASIPLPPDDCGHQVAASLTFNVGWRIPLTAKACFP